MIIIALPVGMIQTNCYIAGCPETKEGAIIDPGGHPERIMAEVELQGLSIKYVLNTHAHFDHYGAISTAVDGSCQPARCGDGLVKTFRADPTDSVEECDDENTDPLDGCDESCQRNDSCGDTTVQSLFEACDDGTPVQCTADTSSITVDNVPPTGTHEWLSTT